MACNYPLASGSTIDCADLNARIGVGKDLILVNYDEFDRTTTLSVETVDHYTNINLLVGATQHTFEGTEYSVVPSISPEVKEDGSVWYGHSILFTVYKKTLAARKTIESIGGAKVIAIMVDRSTGFYEVFGVDQGLTLSAVERPYVGSQKSNFYDVTISTPEIGVMKEGTMGILALNIVVAS